MKRIVTRSIIVLFFLITALVAGVLIFADRHTRTERVQLVADEFFRDPSERNLRRLLNEEADGESSHLKIALVGHAFTKHTSIFRAVYESPDTDLERESMESLKRFGAGVFEYYHANKPVDFDSTFKYATWLNQEAEQAASSNH